MFYVFLLETEKAFFFFFPKGSYSAWPFTLLWGFLFSDNNPQTLQELKLSH